VITDALAQEVIDLANARGFAGAIESVWLYGSRAISGSIFADSDFLITLDTACAPERWRAPLEDGSIASVNVVGPNSLGPHDSGANGGFYFSSKLLGPRCRLSGDADACARILARVFAHMLVPWCEHVMQCHIGDLSDEEAFASLIALKLGFAPHYVIHFSSWRSQPWFGEYWSGSLRSVRAARSQALVREARPLPDFLKNLASSAVLEYLKASFWNFAGCLRRQSSFADDLLAKAHRMAITLDKDAVTCATLFLRNKLACVLPESTLQSNVAWRKEPVTPETDFGGGCREGQGLHDSPPSSQEGGTRDQLDAATSGGTLS
jgi:hypothetical protein